MKWGAPGVIERAFQLAQSSVDVEQIRVQLRKEGYSNVDAHLAGPKIRSDLTKIIRRPAEAAEEAAGDLLMGTGECDGTAMAVCPKIL